MSFDPAWASHFSDPAWVAIELYARVVSPLQLIVEFQDLPYIPFGQQQPCRMAIRDVGESQKRHQQVSIIQKMHVVDSYESSGQHIDDWLKVHWEDADAQGFDRHVSSQLLQDWIQGSKRDDWKGFLSAAREDGATQDELQKIKRVPNWYRVLANAKCVGQGLPPQFPSMLGQKPAAAKHE